MANVKYNPRGFRSFLYKVFGKTISSGEFARWIVYALIIGTVSALGVSAIYYGLEYLKHLLMVDVAQYPVYNPLGEREFTKQPEGDPIFWVLFILPIAGGLISGIIVYTLAPEAEGNGTEAMIDAFHNKKGFIRGRVPIIKAITSMITIASGGSAGREGPISQIGAGFGSFLARRLKLSTRETRILLLAGAAGGLGAIFRAPLGGAITAIEVLYREDFESEALIPSIISSVVSYTIFTSIFTTDPIFGPSELFVYSANPLELLFYLALAVVCIPIGISYIKVFYGIRDKLFARINIPKHFKPAIGGLFVALCGLSVCLILGSDYWASVYGGGWGFIQRFLDTPYNLSSEDILVLIYSMAIIMVFKILTTSFTLGSGGSGGIFGPTLFIGGMLGGIIGFSGYLFFPDIVQHPHAFILVGMASFFAGVANAPMASLIMICELSGGYDLILPLLLVNAIALVFTRGWSIYEKQVLNKFHSPAHIGNFTIDILEKITVNSILVKNRPITTIRTGITITQFLEIYKDTENQFFPVLDKHGKPIGILAYKNVRNALLESSIHDLIIVDELLTPFVYVTPNQNLHEALIVFLESGYSQIPVINPEKGNNILGLLNYDDLISVYHNEIVKMKQDEED